MEKMMMPAYYNVLSTEEMTYTEGGATATMSEALLCWLIPPYGWFKGVTAVRDYRRKNPNTWMEKGLDALATDMEKSTANTIRDLACAAWFVTSTASGVGLVINAAIIPVSYTHLSTHFPHSPFLFGAKARFLAGKYGKNKTFPNKNQKKDVYKRQHRRNIEFQ